MSAFVAAPASELSDRLRKLRSHIKDARYFAAKQEHDILSEAITHPPPEGQDALYSSIRAELCSAEITLMLERNEECENALREYNMETTEDERWVLGLDMFGYRTHYIVEEDHNVLVRIEGSQENLPLFEQLAVIRELQLYKEWVPFCSKSEMLHEISHTDMIAFMHIWSPLGTSRDLVVEGYGADCLRENGKIIIVAKSIESYEGVDLPAPSKGWFHDRAELTHMSVIFDMKSAECANVVMSMKVNPKLRLPQKLLNFFITRLTGVFLYLQHKKAVEVSQDPDGEHGAAIKENKSFYYEWLLPKMFDYAFHMNWDLPEHTPLMTSVFEDMKSQADTGDLSLSLANLIATIEAKRRPEREPSMSR